MKKLLFALVMLMTGAFAFAAGSPASAMTAGAVTGVSDIVKPGGAIQTVDYWDRHYCYEHPWRCRNRYYYRRHYDRPYYRPYYFNYYRPHYWRYRHRPWWW
jgi:hypothetical protein